MENSNQESKLDLNISSNNLSPSNNNSSIKNIQNEEPLLLQTNSTFNSSIKRQSFFKAVNSEPENINFEETLLNFFKGKKIYIEIYNGNDNVSDSFYEILFKYKITQCKRLHKRIDYIIFKDGHLKTLKYAVLNNLKVVNPLWIDDKINLHIFKEDDEYFIKTNFGDILIEEKYSQDKKDANIKLYDHELEVEYDEEYANIIDKQREMENQINEKEKSFKVNRMKRKSITKVKDRKEKDFFILNNENKNLNIIPEESNNKKIENYFYNKSNVKNIFADKENTTFPSFKF